MVVVLKNNAPADLTGELISELKGKNLDVQINTGVDRTVLGLLGDVTIIDPDALETQHPIIEKVLKVSEPYKKANIRFHPEPTVVNVSGNTIGDKKKLALIAGPCSVESEEQIIEVAKGVKAAGAKFLRGGAYKPRTSPYAFQGMQFEGLKLLKEAKEVTGLPIVSEIMSASHIDMFNQYVDVFQVGARNMQNFEMLKELGKVDKPILLKRGLANTLEELLMSAEYIMSGGNENVILCERGVRTFETYTRNTLDISAIPALKKMTHLPVVIDPSHACGMSWMVEPLAKAAVAAGADGLIIEVHNNPKKALCDGQQSLTIEQYEHLVNKIKKIADIEERSI
ncbi:3-deoxy-7-phosphoheptulonate synthase [Acetivibrio sp. MSJd-27]|jgi:3-deoxy-7-phosphoheptulonate synthase|uniref:3-deoxy-7-phosphoheptulonate synthase n=1 Tax=Acetivibrio sp. MSJd-27 TaxID=2841523 RepID=UPI0015AB0892|nr:3-deoxy-7-phosphoheptulonate synthase [Acetivibrio sp. MSJd-27]MBU5449289.1 3-deoxy-7-phosphoheptulonate synthase [Acetivibrio sp. MSJd-27]